MPQSIAEVKALWEAALAVEQSAARTLAAAHTGQPYSAEKFEQAMATYQLAAQARRRVQNTLEDLSLALSL